MITILNSNVLIFTDTKGYNHMTFENLLKKAEEGDVQAQYDVAYAYEYGDGIAADDELALHWYEMLAEQGYREGNQGAASVLMRQGHKAANRARIFNDKYKTALDYPENNTYNQALDCESNENFEQALDLYYKSAVEENYGMAYFRLALYFGSGFIVEYDFEKEISFLAAAADCGVKEAIFRLAVCFENGDNGIESDIDEAISLYKSAIAAGIANAEGRSKRALIKKQELETSQD